MGTGDIWLQKWFKKLGISQRDDIYAEYVEIPIEFAEEALGHQNEHSNRPKKLSQIKELSQANLEGEWGPSNDIICFTKQGRCLNGQNRLNMVKDTGKPIKNFLGFNFPPSAFANMDGVIRRTVADAFYVDKLDNNKELAVAVRLVWIRLNRGDVRGSKQLRTKQSLKILNEHADLTKSIKFIVDLDEQQDRGLSQLLSLGYAGALHYFMSASNVEKPKTTANEFWENVADYEVLKDGSAPVKLRVALQKNRKPTNANKLDRDSLVALVIKAWLAYVNGEKVDRLSVQKGERPIIGGLDLEPEDEPEEVEPEVKAESNGHSECPKGGKHKWGRDESGEGFCTKCLEPAAKKKKRKKVVATAE